MLFCICSTSLYYMVIGKLSIYHHYRQSTVDCSFDDIQPFFKFLLIHVLLCVQEMQYFNTWIFPFLQILRLDITPMTSSPSTSLDPASIVAFSPQALNQLLVVTTGARLIKFNASNGQLLSEVSNIHRERCTSLAVDKTGQYLLTGGGDKVVKVWDYNMALDLNFQVRP